MIAASLVLFYVGILFLILLGALRERNFFSFRVILWMSLGLVYLLPMITKPGPEWVDDAGFLLLLFAGLAGFAMALLLLDRTAGVPGRLYSSSQTIHQFAIKRSAIQLLTAINVLLLMFGIWRALPGFSPEEVLLFLVSDRVSSRFEDPFSTSALFRFIKSILSSATLLFVFYAWRERRIIGTLIYLLLLLELVVTSHTRFAILTVLFYPILFVHFFKRRLGINTVLALVLVSVALLSLGNFVRGGYFENESGDGIASTLAPEIAVNQLRRGASYSTDYFYSIYQLVGHGPMEVEYGLQYFKYLPLAPVPRLIWSDKPTVSYFHRATELIEGRLPGPDEPRVYTTTILGEAYHQFSVLGVLFTPFFYTMLIVLLIRILQQLQYSDMLFWSILLHVPMDIRGGMFSVTVNAVTLLVFVAMIFLIGYGKRRSIVTCNTFVHYV